MESMGTRNRFPKQTAWFSSVVQNSDLDFAPDGRSNRNFLGPNAGLPPTLGAVMASSSSSVRLSALSSHLSSPSPAFVAAEGSALKVSVNTDKVRPCPSPLQ